MVVSWISSLQKCAQYLAVKLYISSLQVRKDVWTEGIHIFNTMIFHRDKSRYFLRCGIMISTVMICYFVYEVLITKKNMIHVRPDVPHTTIQGKVRNMLSNGQVPYQNPELNETLEQLNSKRVRQDYPKLISIIQEHFLIPPSTEKYNLDNPHRLDYSNGQTPFVDNRLHFMVSGYMCSMIY